MSIFILRLSGYISDVWIDEPIAVSTEFSCIFSLFEQAMNENKALQLEEIQIIEVPDGAKIPDTGDCLIVKAIGVHDDWQTVWKRPMEHVKCQKG